MRNQRLTPWDRQPHGFARIRPEILALGLVHALSPGLDQAQFVLDHAQPSAAQPVITGYRGNDFDRATPLGLAMQMHPFVGYESGDTPSNNAVKTLRYPVTIQPGDDLTVIWLGYLDTPGEASNEGFGALWALGADGNGNGWGARQIANANGNLSAYYIDSSPAQYVTDLAVPGGIAAGQLVRAGYRKVGASGQVTSFDGVSRSAATTVQGNGVMRSSTVGFDLAGSGQNPQANGAPSGWLATGHNRCLVALVFRRALTDEQVYRLLTNPWQAWARDDALYMPMVAAPSQDATAPGAVWAMRLGFAPGAPSAGGTAAGATLPASLALAPGAVQASSTATGAVLPMSLSWAPGSASGSGNATAPGASWPVSLTLSAGQGSASSLAAGALWPVGLGWAPGAASGSGAGTAPGAAWPISVGWLPGAASATESATAPAASWPISFGFAPGGPRANSLIAGSAWAMSVGWQPGSVVGPADFQRSIRRTYVAIAEPRLYSISSETRGYLIVE